MKNLGLLLTTFGTLYILLTLFGLNYSFVTWIDNWGESIGWSIRGAALLFGVLLYTIALYLESNSPIEADADAANSTSLSESSLQTEEA
ncbi:hypothetical protein FLL45_14800 [Aliikangiella marina]|uniref:Uncharacterized protein n=1 Tax=Aliikangiella marina TaxID=1712262 RepID=A0A545TA80_9GAMM|nr:hypothetical protein [Aliikangiella marina]TQV74123.1 hypothetical protein FLL45_14800 [Aliikangiella marina]